MTDETTLKPCPFCGGEVEIYNPMPGYASGYGTYCKGCDSYFTHGDDEQESIEAWNTRYEPTCHYFPDVTNTAFDENDNEIETGEAHPDGCDYSCSNCGNMMLGGDEGGWFDETEGEYGGWDYKPRFNYCPNCGAKVIKE